MQLSGILVIILGRHNFEGMAVEFRCTAALITHILLLEISTFLTDLKAKIIIYHMQEIIKIARKQYKIQKNIQIKSEKLAKSLSIIFCEYLYAISIIIYIFYTMQAKQKNLNLSAKYGVAS